jgi:hypothetical protein
MFECKYKLELEDSIKCAKYVYKSQKRKQDKIIAILIPFLMVAIIAMLVYDFISGRSFVWDIILLIALIVLEVMYLIIPIMLVKSQKKSYNQQNLGEMDYLHIVIEDKQCTETLFKDNQEVAKNTHNLKFLTSYIEDKDYLILIFNKVEFVCIKKVGFVGDLNKLKNHLQKTMAKK